eukprot:scaffold38062_cov23-Cyclotella_meneghiniana.AAC.1
MALPISPQPLAFPLFSQHSRSRTEGTSPIGAAAAAAITYRDISLSPYSCHQMPAPAAALCPWPSAISFVRPLHTHPTCNAFAPVTHWDHHLSNTSIGIQGRMKLAMVYLNTLIPYTYNQF